jgi:hypothetical protein
MASGVSHIPDDPHNAVLFRITMQSVYNDAADILDVLSVLVVFNEDDAYERVVHSNVPPVCSVYHPATSAAEAVVHKLCHHKPHEVAGCKLCTKTATGLRTHRVATGFCATYLNEAPTPAEVMGMCVVSTMVCMDE